MKQYNIDRTSIVYENIDDLHHKCLTERLHDFRIVVAICGLVQGLSFEEDIFMSKHFDCGKWIEKYSYFKSLYDAKNYGKKIKDEGELK